MVDQETLSVIIVNYNAGHNLGECVQSLAENVPDVPMEVVIIDNASTDDSIQQVSKDFPDIRIVSNSQNRGFAAACNQGIRQVRGGAILLLNPDTIVLGNAVKDSLEFLTGTPEAGIVGGQLVDSNGSPRVSFRTFPTVWDYLFDILFLPKLFNSSRFSSRPRLTSTRFTGPIEVDMVPGAFFMFKRAVTDDIGLLDEGYFIYVEERDFCYRAKAAGWKVYFYPRAEIIHVGGVSTRQRALEMFIEKIKGKIRFHQIHDSHQKASLIKFLIFLGMLTRFLVWNILAGIVRTPHVLSKRRIYTGAVRWFLKGNKYHEVGDTLKG